MSGLWIAAGMIRPVSLVRTDTGVRWRRTVLLPVGLDLPDLKRRVEVAPWDKITKRAVIAGHRRADKENATVFTDEGVNLVRLRRGDRPVHIQRNLRRYVRVTRT